MQQFNTIAESTIVKNLPSLLNGSLSTILSQSSGVSFPTTNLQVGQPCFRTDTNRLYVCTNAVTQTWALLYDFQTGGDAQFLNGVSASNYARRDVANTFAALATFDAGIAVNPNGYALAVNSDGSMNRTAFDFKRNSVLDWSLSIDADGDLNFVKGAGGKEVTIEGQAIWHNGNDDNLIKRYVANTFNAINTFEDDIHINADLALESGHHRITYNDGGGNFNIRVGHKWDTADHRHTVNGSGAIHVDFSHETANPTFKVKIGGNPTGKLAGDAVVWANEFVIASSGTITWGGNTIWHAGNDGANSNLDADLLDAQHGSYYLDFNNFNNLPATWAPSAHGHAISDVAELQAALDGKLASGAKAADSGLLDGISSNGFARLGTTSPVLNYLYTARSDNVNSAMYVRQGGTGDIARFFQNAGASTTTGLNMVTIKSDGSIEATGGYSGDILGGKITGNVTLDNSIRIQAKQVDGSIRWIVYMDASDMVQLGAANNTLHLNGAGTAPLWNGTDEIYHAGNSSDLARYSATGTFADIMTFSKSVHINPNGYNLSFDSDGTVSRDAISFKRNGVEDWSIDIGAEGNLNFAKGTGGNEVRIQGQTIWHAGNDGAGSGMDADTVDGLQGSQLVRNDQDASINGGRLVLRTSKSINPSNATNKTYSVVGNETAGENLAFVMNGDDATDRIAFMTDYGSTGTYKEQLSINAQTGDASFAANVTAVGDVQGYSDARLKKNIAVIDDALAKVLGIGGYVYDRTDTGMRQAGVLAQELVGVLPEVVSTDENGFYRVSYGNIVALLIEAIKELEWKNSALSQRVEMLEAV